MGETFFKSNNKKENDDDGKNSKWSNYIGDYFNHLFEKID